MSSSGPLAGLVVVELTDEIGSYCGKLLADLGADVIKVEEPGGGQQRHTPPFFGEDRDVESAIPFWSQNTSKRSLELDFTKENERIRVRDLMLAADVVIEDFPPGYLAEYNLAYTDLKQERPDLVYASITSFGQTGPHANFEATDLVVQAMAGVLILAGETSDPPNFLYGNQGAICASIQAAQGILLALRLAETHGFGQHVDVSAQEALSVAQETAMMQWDFQGTNRGRTGEFGIFQIAVPGSHVYQTSDGYVTTYISAPGGADLPVLIDWMRESDAHSDLDTEPFQEIISGLNSAFLTKILSNPTDFPDVLDSLAHIDKVIAQFFLGLTASEAYEEGQSRRLLIGIVSTPRDLAENSQLRARDWYQVLEFQGKKIEFPGVPYRLSKTSAELSPPPSLNNAADIVLPDRLPRTFSSTRPRLPLEGVRVADFSWFGAGPIAAQTLATFGAEVIRIESETKIDSLRLVQPYATNEDGSFKTGYNISGYFNNFNAGKHSLLLNLNDERGQELAYQLIEKSDLFLTNFTPRVIEKWNLGYEQISKVNPKIIALYAPMQGLTGPHRDFLGFGAVLTPITGISHLSGFPNRPPIGIGTNYPDYVINPGHSVTALLAALRHRVRTGEGQLIEMPQIESVVNVLATAVLNYTANGVNGIRTGNWHPTIAPHGVFQCLDDDTVIPNERWVAVACRDDGQWQSLCEELGHPDLANDPRFQTFSARSQNSGELEIILASWFKELFAEEIMQRLQSVGVPCGVVQTAQDILERDLHVQEREYYQYLEHPETGLSCYDGPCARLSETPGEHRSAAPLFGEQTFEVASQILGLSADEIADFVSQDILA